MKSDNDYIFYVHENGIISTIEYENRIGIYSLRYGDRLEMVEFLFRIYKCFSRSPKNKLFHFLFFAKNWKINAYDIYKYSLVGNLHITNDFIEALGFSYREYSFWINENDPPFLYEMPVNRNPDEEFKSIISRQGMVI